MLSYCLVHHLEMAQFAGQGQRLAKLYLSPPSFLHRNSPKNSLSLITRIYRIGPSLGLLWSGISPSLQNQTLQLHQSWAQDVLY